MSTHRHWGDLPALPETDTGIAAIEREQITKLKGLEVDGPRLHQPSMKHCPPGEVYPAELFALDSLTAHTIKLVQHAKALRALIHNIQQQKESWKAEDGEVPAFPSTPPLPEYPGPPKLEKMKSFPFVSKDMDSDFVRGKGKPPPEIDGASCRKLLKRSVAAVFAATGFDNCAESILDVMTDVTHEYFEQITKLLRNAVDNEALRGATGFPDVIQQVYQEIGIGNVTKIHDFYQTRVVIYHDHMLQTCQRLMEEYDTLKQSELQPIENLKSPFRVKEEPLSDIHFPLAEDVEEILGPDGIINLDALGLDMNTVQDTSLTTEEENKWLANVKSEPTENKKMIASHTVTTGKSTVAKNAPGLSTLDDYDHEDTQSLKADTPHTPQVNSEVESIGEPGSVPVADIMSPPSAGIRPPKAKKKKLK